MIQSQGGPMNHGREKKVPSKKQKLSDIKKKEDFKQISNYEKPTFSHPKTSTEISVIHPVKEKGKDW